MKKQFKRVLASALCVATVLSNCMISSVVETKAAGDNLALNKTVTASAQYTTMPATYAVDGNDDTRWSSEAAAVQWLQVDLGTESEIQEFRIVAENDTNQRIGQFKIEGSNNNSTFTEIYQSEDKSADGFAQNTVITLDNAVSYRYVKLTVQKLKSGAYPSVSLREFEVRGVAEEGAQDPEENVALHKTAVASSQEADSVRAANAVDGNTSARESRWGSAMKNAPHWIYVDLGEVMDVRTVKVFWENRKATAYKIQTAVGDTAPAADSTDWVNAKVITTRPAALNDVIVLDSTVQARYVRLYIDTATSADPDGGVDYNTVSLYEVEVYGGEPAEPQITIDTVLSEIAVTQPTADTETLEVNLPEYEGFTVKYNGTDYEQVIGVNREIYKPIVTTTVKASFKVTEDATGEYKFKEIPVTVPGKYAAAQGDNAAPEVLPELREWKGNTGTFAPTDASRIVYKDDSLKDMADVFAADYKEITGKDINVVKADTANAGDFFFALTTDKSKGLQDEGHLMTIADKVTVEAETATGAFWATRTILQSLKQTGNIPCGITRDYPLYKVRGFILDVGRKTFTMDYLRQIVKQMSWYKMNDFQVHLNDNYIFLEEYAPLGMDPMTAYSGFRLESDIKKGGNGGLNQADLTSKDVFYTKAEFRDFIKDSRVMGVNIVPEIDAPAHSLAFTKVRPDLRQGTKDRQNDHLNLKEKYDDVLAFIQGVFGEYMTGTNPVFDEDTIVHVGADEYGGANERYRQFCNDMTGYVKESGRQPRIWGSLTWIPGETDVIGEGVQMNLWNFGWANMDQMYEEGFDLINCNDGNFYIVPNAGYYHPNGISNGEYYNANLNSIGGVTIPAGDKQMSGAAFAIWNDMIDRKDNGVSEYYVYNLIENGFPLMGANLWGRGSKDVNAADALRNELGDAPGTNFGYEVEADKNGVIKQELFDTVKNGVNAEAVSVDGKDALKLNGGESYVTTGLETVGLGNDLRVKVKRTTDSTEEQILFESPYGTIKAVQKETGKVGFSRENFDYSFDYTLPVDEWVELEMKNTLRTAMLYVNGELVDTLGDDEMILGNRMLATTMFPIEKIGSATKAFEGYVDDVRVGVDAAYNSTMALDYAVITANALLAENENTELAALVEQADAIFAKFAPTAEEVEELADQINAKIKAIEYEEADYSRVENYQAIIPEDLSAFTPESVAVLNRVLASVRTGLPAAMQSTVDGYEKALADALAGLEVRTEANVNYVDNSTLTATASSKQDGEGPERVLDGDTATLWHTLYANASAPKPHWIDLEMQTPTAVNALTYVPRQSGANGRLTKYKVQVSDDGVTYRDIVAEGTLANNADTKVIEFPATTTKHVRLVFVEAGGGFGSAAELKLHLANVDADVDGLNAVITEAKAITNAGYTTESWEALQAKITAAEVLAGSTDADANDVEIMKRKLAKAMTSLVLTEKEDPDPKPDTEAPTVPTGLKAVEVGKTTVEIKWNASTDNKGVEGYLVYINGELVLGPDGEKAYVTESKAVIEKLQPGTQYKITVAAFDEAGNLSAQSEALTVKTKEDPKEPEVPDNGNEGNEGNEGTTPTTPPTVKPTPETGDTSAMSMMLIMMVFAAGVVVMTIHRRRVNR